MDNEKMVLSLEYRQALASSPLLRNFEPARRKELLGLGSARGWKRGDYLYRAGDPIDAFFFLLSGTAREFYSGGGDDYLRRLARPGCYVSLHSVFDRKQRYGHYCQALSAIVAFAWPVSVFAEHLRSHPELGLEMAGVLAEYFEHSCRKNCLCRKPAARSRVAGYLLSRLGGENAQRRDGFRSDPDQQVDLWPLTQAAEDINLSRESFSRALVALKRDGLVSCAHGKVIIHDLKGLKSVSGVE